MIFNIFRKGNENNILFDKEDLHLISKYSWHVTKQGYVGAYSGDSQNKTVLLHRLIMKPKVGMEVDHINGNGLDNRRSNLRLATKSQNGMNRGPNGNRMLKGITKMTYANRWMARINFNNKGLYLGLYKTPIEAAIAYNKKAKELYGEFAYLNIVK